MPKKQIAKQAKFTGLFVFLAFALGGSLVLLVSVGIVNRFNAKEPEAFITDGKFKQNEPIAYFNSEKLNAPTEPWPAPTNLKNILSAQDNENKWVEIDLSQQKVRAWNGNHLDYEFLASTGKKQWGTETPNGSYRIWSKLKSTLMHGGSGSTYYYLPNVPCTQYFYKGYGLHGTYWHNNFGHPMSHGCVNMRTEDACTLFYWTSPPINDGQYSASPTADYLGTKVVVHGETPWE